MKWFFGDVEYALWKALDHPEDWIPVSDYAWKYGNIRVWAGAMFHIEKPMNYEFGVLDKVLLHRKFNKMLAKRIAGEFIKSLVG